MLLTAIFLKSNSYCAVVVLLQVMVAARGALFAEFPRSILAKWPLLVNKNEEPGNLSVAGLGLSIETEGGNLLASQELSAQTRFYESYRRGHKRRSQFLRTMPIALCKGMSRLQLLHSYCCSCVSSSFFRIALSSLPVTRLGLIDRLLLDARCRSGDHA